MNGLFHALGPRWNILHDINRSRPALLPRNYHEMNRPSNKLDGVDNANRRSSRSGWRGYLPCTKSKRALPIRSLWALQVCRSLRIAWPPSIAPPPRVRVEGVWKKANAKAAQRPQKTLIDDLPLFRRGPYTAPRNRNRPQAWKRHWQDIIPDELLST